MSTASLAMTMTPEVGKHHSVITRPSIKFNSFFSSAGRSNLTEVECLRKFAFFVRQLYKKKKAKAAMKAGLAGTKKLV